MKITVDPRILAEAVAWAARAIPLRPTVPVLSGLLLEADGDSVTVSAFDYDVSVTATVGADVAEPGRILLPGRVLAEVVKALPTISFLEVAADDTEAVLTCGGAEFALPLLPVADFPALPAAPAAVGTVDGGLFAAAVGQVAVAASKDDTLPMLAGLRVDVAGDQLTLAATDRYRIACRDLTWALQRPPGAGVLVPAAQVADFARALAGDVCVGFDDRLAVLATADRQTVIRLLDPTFPDYRVRIDAFAEPPINARVPVALLAAAVKRVAIVAEKNTSVRLSFTPDSVLVRAGGGGLGRGAETVPCEVDDSIDLAFMPQYLADGLAGVEGEWATLGITTPTKGVVISGEDPAYKYLIQPLRDV